MEVKTVAEKQEAAQLFFRLRNYGMHSFSEYWTGSHTTEVKTLVEEQQAAQL
jgi:hypothetical protein